MSQRSYGLEVKVWMHMQQVEFDALNRPFQPAWSSTLTVDGVLQADLAKKQAAAFQAKLERAAEEAESRRVAEEGRIAEQHETLRLKLQQAQADRSAPAILITLCPFSFLLSACTQGSCT